MSADHDSYLAVLRASYDYEPQAEDEIEIKENQLLFLLDKPDDDWWKVKCKSDLPDEEGAIGLVPSAYVEEPEAIATVKAIYDYEAIAPGELSIKEDELLAVYAQEEDWWLVQSKTEGGGAGFVPATYVEETTGDSPAALAVPSISQIVVPPSPPRPVSTYVDPADRVAAAKATAAADDIQTWSVSEVDKKGKKKKGTLGVGNGAVFFASESDKTPVQKWQTAAISSSKIDKSKHVLIEISDPPTSLHFHAHSKDVAEAIVAKLESSKAISTSSSTLDTPTAASERASPGPKVHFAEEEPEVIPPREPSEDGYEEPEAQEAAAQEYVQEEEPEEPVHEVAAVVDGDAEIAVALYDFTADGEDELSVTEGEQLTVLEKDGDDWWKCRNAHGAEGVVPAQYLESKSGAATEAPLKDTTAAEEAAAAEVARLEQERIQREKAEKMAKEREAKQRAQAAAAAADAERKRKQQERERKEKEMAEEQRKKAERERERERAQKEEQRRSSTPQPPRKSTDHNGSSSRSSSERRGPPPEQCRIWRDRSGQFTVEAALLGYQNGKLRLHKVNGVIIEVPAEKMSQEDMKHVEKLLSKRPPRQSSTVSDDDVPLADRRLSLQTSAQVPPKAAPPPKKGPTIDWFEFFLNAGCDIDDCTRYAQSFERDKIDEALLPDITESTMRLLGLREGDIIRVKKAISQRQPKTSDGAALQEQIRKDEELAKALQAQETGGSSKSSSPAPNLFASGPNGALKNNTPRRGRPQPSKSLPPSSVDLTAISTASDQIQRTGTPGSSSSTPLQPPARSNSAALVASGFDDDAWTNRPSSTKPAPSSTPTPAAAPVASPLPPVPPPPPARSAADSIPARAPSAPVISTTQPQSTGGSGGNLAKTTESDIFEQLARLSELRTKSPPSSFAPQPNNSMLGSPSPSLTSSVSYQSGLGMRSSPAPMGQHLQSQQTGMFPPPQQQNGPRGPFAPVPANQALLQPLIPTQTGIAGFVPTRPASTSSPFQPQPQQPSFLNTQPTGFVASPSLMAQPTGFPAQGPLMSQPTGFPGQGPLMSQPTGFPSSFGQLPSFQQNGGFGLPQGGPNGLNTFGQLGGNTPMPPSPPSATARDTSPANIFAQMKSGTFASGNDIAGPQSADKYDALRPGPPLAMQATGWGGYQGVNSFQAYPGYQH